MHVLYAMFLACLRSPAMLRRAKKWRFDKLSKAELAGLINHHMKQDAPQSATKGYLVKTLMDFASSDTKYENV